MASFRPEPVRTELRLAVAVDFADLFEVTSGVRHRRVADPLRRWAEERAHLRTDQPTDRRLVVDPHIPPEIRRITVWRLRAFGRLWDLEAVGDAGYVRLAAG
ncbi:glycogen debranching N-terminal domain-containing protein [Micromonospora costi]|uniref:Putative glycogen debranching enzyme N-terminal domain-containing protein n=1 Tax=Micromonospora costi TaxID=1530042 RepID=A0A3A9ZUE1_9ACTN|nr:glycogen debranching N-terminal domain-containing protein [Micromonospora costi]RKN51888.1 hypothetical protein D7193_28715 [Micromonospora costi]